MKSQSQMTSSTSTINSNNLHNQPYLELFTLKKENHLSVCHGLASLKFTHDLGLVSYLN